MHASAKAVLAASDSGFEDFCIDLRDEAAVRKAFGDVATYVRSLEVEIKELKERKVSSEGPVKPTKPREQIDQEATRLKETVVRGIKRLLTWKSGCKDNSARFVYDGICNDPLVFGAMLKLNGPPKFKTKKIPGSEFERLNKLNLRTFNRGPRYNMLYIRKKDVKIRYNPETGEFKISGSYGIYSY